MRLEAIGRITGLEADSLAVKRDGRLVLDLRGHRLGFEPGRIYVLVGPNGAGKTTLLDTLSGMLRPFEGRVIINGGIDLYGFGVTERSLLRRKHYSYLLQDCLLFENLTVWENILLPSKLAGHTPTRESLDRVLGALRLYDLLRRRPSQLSGGEYRRACLAAALLKAEVAGVVLLDEPTISVERDMIPSIVDLIRGLQGKIVIVATHDPLLIESGDQRIALRAGKLEQA